MLTGLPAKAIESMLVSAPLAKITQTLRHRLPEAVAGITISLCIFAVMLVPLRVLAQQAACPIYIAVFFWFLTHALVRSMMGGRAETTFIKAMRWERAKQDVIGLVPVTTTSYWAVTFAVLIGYPWFVIPPDEELFFSWCTLVPDWPLPDGFLASSTIALSAFCALVDIRNAAHVPLVHQSHPKNPYNTSELQDVRFDSEDDDVLLDLSDSRSSAY